MHITTCQQDWLYEFNGCDDYDYGDDENDPDPYYHHEQATHYSIENIDNKEDEIYGLCEDCYSKWLYRLSTCVPPRTNLEADFPTREDAEVALVAIKLFRD